MFLDTLKSSQKKAFFLHPQPHRSRCIRPPPPTPPSHSSLYRAHGTQHSIALTDHSCGREYCSNCWEIDTTLDSNRTTLLQVGGGAKGLGQNPNAGGHRSSGFDYVSALTGTPHGLSWGVCTPLSPPLQGSNLIFGNRVSCAGV